MDSFKKVLLSAAQDPDLFAVAWRVWAVMIVHLDYGVPKHITQREIGSYLGMGQGNVARAVKVLLDKGLIVPGPRLGKRQLPTYSRPFSVKVVI